MSKPPSRISAGLNNILKASRTEPISYRQVFEWIGKSVPFEIGLVVSTMPRGGLQIVQPQRIPETLARNYSKQFNKEDRATWTAILEQRSVRGSDCWPDDYATTPYVSEFMQEIGLAYVAAAPLQHPVINGYAGAIVLFRSTEQGDFTPADLSKLSEIAGELDVAIEKNRDARQGEACKASLTLAHRCSDRQFVFDKSLKQLMPNSDPGQLDEQVEHDMLQEAKRIMGRINIAKIQDRVALPDSRGDLWIFHVRPEPTYSALGGPVLFFNLQPAACEWAAMKPADFQADPELARLIPALKFMAEEFRRGPTLTEIAHTAHLSPFHFHRRFTELLGMTPKHFMLECQIDDSKHLLVEGKKRLAEIAAINGFAHQSHFTSRFKQSTGLTPTRWRRLAAERRVAHQLEPAMA